MRLPLILDLHGSSSNAAAFPCARRFMYGMHKMWRVQVLKQLPFLQNASPEIFKRLLQRGQLVKYQRGEVMWQPPSGMPPSASLHSAFACLSLPFSILPLPAFPFLACAFSIVSVLLFNLNVYQRVAAMTESGLSTTSVNLAVLQWPTCVVTA